METPSPLLVPIPEVLQGRRVRLELLCLDDAPALWDAIEETKASTDRWIPWADNLCSIDDVRAFIVHHRAKWLLREELGWAIFEHANERLLGRVGLVHINWKIRSFAFEYWLRPTAEGHGYMRESVRLVTALAFNTLCANRVEIRVDPANTRSVLVAESLGFVLEGTLRRSRLDPTGNVADAHVFALIPEDYHRMNWSQASQMPQA